MKLNSFTVCIALCAMVLASCKKQEIKLTPLASLMVANVVNSGGNLVLGTNAAPVYNNYFQAYGMLTGNKEIKLVDTAGGINKVYYNQNKEFVNGGVYSLFLGGTVDAVESVFLKEENIPQYTDDVFGIRILNLCLNNVPISVNLAGAANGSFIPGLGYKAISTFKAVSSKATEGAKIFEFRNATTGDLITALTLQAYELPRFRNITLVFGGKAGAESILRVNNY